MRRYREQRLCQLANVFHEEVLDILTRQNNGGLFFSDAFHEISDVLDCREICQKQINYIDNLVAAERERRQREEKPEEKKQDRTPDKKQAI